ncbi:nuclear GTPase SLIP-GC-like [Archocentrus centrarchus]|uniref:nuclear GTPase SLIP-GC-like n=1 Tax=Archocentrus centrarchus TaxID=63155 RepID=UPI0011EA11CE|nr:nuclear GTPase SLIP-GC-like [Archocentrus centrarchus]
MYNFVQNKLREWNLSQWVDKFKDEEITKESLFFLDNQDIAELFPRIRERLIFKMRLHQLKKEQSTNQETADFSAQVLPSTSSKGKRKLDHQDESQNLQPSTKRHCDTEERILYKVKEIMRNVKDQINDMNDNKELRALLKNKISNLETNKTELIGVFGKTGAGKSSLINAIINEKNLLPFGSVSACTSVMIKVEANTHSSKYEAEIEFITKEEWHKELLSWHTLKKGTDDYRDMARKLSALYGKEWENQSTEFLMKDEHFQNIPKLSEKSEKKSLECNTAQELSEELFKYTKDGSKHEDGNTAQQWYWPLVKCVTVRVPKNDLLQHVTVVDLPGNGDRNKSRSEMWKQVVGDCSTVWIVAEIKRAASETEAWEILENACGHIGNGGQCQRIHFICTHSDPSDDRVKINMDAKKKVKNEFKELNMINKHFTEDCFKVFTVSAKEFLEDSCVKEDDNEIPKLQDFLKNLNKCHSETFIYVSGAYGILSLIEGARHRKQGVEKADDVSKALEENMIEQLVQVETAVEEAIKAFDQCLREGVNNSKTSEEKLKSFLDRKDPSFFKTLQAVVKKDGTHITTKGEQINLNVMLASCLTDSIDEKFRKTFPNDVKGGLFNVISKFSLGTESLIQKYKDVELQLIFLQTEEDENKTQVNKIILDQKKIIYKSLRETIEENMKKCYEDAKKIEGDGAQNNMRTTIERYVYSNKQMYEEAKKNMLKKMNYMKTTIKKELEETMKESIKHSLRTYACLLPVFSEQLREVKKHYDELKSRQDEEMSHQQLDLFW